MNKKKNAWKVKLLIQSYREGKRKWESTWRRGINLKYFSGQYVYNLRRDHELLFFMVKCVQCDYLRIPCLRYESTEYHKIIITVYTLHTHTKKKISLTWHTVYCRWAVINQFLFLWSFIFRALISHAQLVYNSVEKVDKYNIYTAYNLCNYLQLMIFVLWTWGCYQNMQA